MSQSNTEHPFTAKLNSLVTLLKGHMPNEGWRPQVSIVLGTGLDSIVDLLENPSVVPFENLIGLPLPQRGLHKGEFHFGNIGKTRVMIQLGRTHWYEGYSLQETCIPIWMSKMMGCESQILTNAVGSMNPTMLPGSLVVLKDHINLIPDNPLRGDNNPELGPRFPDMFDTYDKTLRGKLAAAYYKDKPEHWPSLREGKMVAVGGPNLETPMEYKMLRRLGADVVGMSTVPEAIVGVHCGLKTLAISTVTDLCTPAHLKPCDINEIIEQAIIGGDRIKKFLPKFLELLS
jgi:purine-nucleoside phosphorylase